LYFFSTLVVAMLVAMLVTAALSIARGGLAGSQHQEGADLALRAAESGLRYAQTRLGADPLWRGSGNGTILATPDLTVVEDQGNVIGIVRANGGQYGQFRIRFNYQDGSSDDFDDLPNPAAAHWIDNPFVSVNNIAGGSSRPVPRADGPNFSVGPASQQPYQVPLGTACILVEGRAGTGLSGLSPSDPSAPAAAGGSVTSRVLEAYLQRNGQPGGDAAAMAAGDLRVQLASNGDKLQVDSSSGVPRIRSKAGIVVEGGNSSENYASPRGEAVSRDGLQALSTVSQQTEGASDEFYKLKWEDVKKAGPDDHVLSAGTYVMWDDGTLHHYALNYDDYVAFIKTNPTDPGNAVALDEDGPIVLDGRKLRIKDNIYIEPDGDVDEFNFIPRQGAQEDPPGVAEGGDPDDVSVTQTSMIGYVSSLPPAEILGGSSQGSVWPLPNVTLPMGYTNEVVTSGYTVRLEYDQGSGGALLSYSSPLQGLSFLGAVTAAGPEWFNGSSPEQRQFQQICGYLLSSGSGDSMKEIDLGNSVPATLTPDDLEVVFEPPGGESAILSSEGSIRLGSKVTGKGGSITSGQQIRIVGAGTDLDANIEDGLNLYAKGNIVLSSLKSKPDDTYEYKDFKMKGVIYTWGNFNAKVGTDSNDVTQWGSFSLEGALIAYGGDPAGAPGSNGAGRIDIASKASHLIFNPAYLNALERAPDPGPLHQTFFTRY
jgi:hypothetical protein